MLSYKHDIWYTTTMSHEKAFQDGTPTRFGLWGGGAVAAILKMADMHFQCPLYRRII